MVQGYYTLEEAAQILGMGAEALSHMAQRREVRAFADRGTWRFRTQDIEELARRRGLGSNPELPLGDAPKKEADVFNFSLGESDQVEIGQELVSETPSGAKKTGSKGKTPPPKAGSDSDVRLVADGSGVSMQVAGDSGVKGSKSGRKPGKQDSGVKLVDVGHSSDSDVQIVGESKDDIGLGKTPSKSGTDSDVRLEKQAGVTGRGPDDSFLTEEIDLDSELRKAEEKARPKTKQPPSGTAPFELSEADLDIAKSQKTKQMSPSSSDFDLSLDIQQDLSPLEPSSSDLPTVPAQKKLEEANLGGKAKGKGKGDSGINLQKPADSGVSLEKSPDSSDEIDFELSLDSGSSSKQAKSDPSADSSSEFELTLEDSARLAPLEDDKKDIFETDFEVPALEDSGSQAVALDDSDTDLESSDFDLALDEGDMAAEDESGSQVVALDDADEVDEGAATVARTGKKGSKASLLDEDAAELGEGDLEEEAVGAPIRRGAAASAAPADWGVFTPVTLLVSVLFMFLLGLMSFELVRGMWGYRQPNKVSALLIRSVGGLFYDAKELDVD